MNERPGVMNEREANLAAIAFLVGALIGFWSGAAGVAVLWWLW